MGLSINAAGEVQPREQDLQTLYKILDPSQIVPVRFQNSVALWQHPASLRDSGG